MNAEQTNKATINYFKCVQQYVENLGKVKATVGVHAEDSKKDKYGVTTVQKAIWNEFGTNNIAKRDYDFIKNGKQYFIHRGDNLSIPARPFVRLYVHPKSVLVIEREFAKNFDVMLRFHNRLTRPLKAATTTMDNIGRKAKEEMKNLIKNGNTYKKNSDFTVQIKGFDHPLYETGDLLNSIDSKLERRGV